MSDVAFYQLQKLPLDRALPRLLEKSYAAGKRAVVIAGSEERVEALTALLWTYDPDSWLPHGSTRDGNPEAQPIWITDRDENPNGAVFLFLTDGADSAHLGDFERCFDLFDGHDPEALAAARQRWVRCKAAGHHVTYWQQTGQGGWERKA